ncbi:MAG: Arabinose operon transcriptional regulator AraC [Verrucomicrobia bacterium]|nr:Arabinose operon transcriptional regulator AraC [Verrucomicrobiota bacterium]
MPTRANTPAPPPGMLVTGHFNKGPRYMTYREHGTRDWLLVYTVSGHGRYGFAGGEYITQPGDMVLVRPGVLHDYGTARGHPNWEPLWAHFLPRPGWMPWLDWPEVAPGILHLPLRGHEISPRIARRFRDVVRLNAGPSRQRESLALNALEEILLWCDLANPKRETAGLDSRIRRSLDFICEHFAEPLTVPRIAAHCGLSPSRFAHLFREQTGETPQRYLELQRLNRARQLLEFTQEPVAAVARAVGFENPFYFTLRFKRHGGAGPRAWRRRRKSEPR